MDDVPSTIGKSSESGVGDGKAHHVGRGGQHGGRPLLSSCCLPCLSSTVISRSSVLHILQANIIVVTFVGILPYFRFILRKSLEALS